MRALLAAALAVPQIAFQAPGPTVQADRAEARVGDTVTVDLAAWPPGNVLVELCGNGGARGSADCAVAAAATTFVDANGRGTAMVTVVKPPVGCPCVISARPVTGGRARTVPLAVKGVPTLPGDPARERLRRPRPRPGDLRRPGERRRAGRLVRRARRADRDVHRPQHRHRPRHRPAPRAGRRTR
ncbi:hypothetical protein [Actinomadura madurae]|nr:hypothetical protein [Actinomadura madurae]MCP9951152.1 hypothetical protein [Actinomadura madurae]MCQ0016589.1 hypothetical protein [Actinomadura madurae]